MEKIEKKKLLIASMSGGLDSATTVALALKEGMDVQPIVFEYGQKNFVELIAQKKIVEFFSNQYPNQIRETVTIDTTKIIQEFIFNYQALRDSGKVLEKTGEEFYTPSRNLLFMTLCAVIGEIIAISEDYSEILLGLGIHKHSSENYKKDYWDITPEFAIRLQHLLDLNDSVRVMLYTPFVNYFKSEIISKAEEVGLPIYLTWSCYDPQITKEIKVDKVMTLYSPCLVCEACLERSSQAKSVGIYNVNDYSITVETLNPRN